MKKKKLLELFAGSRSVGKVADKMSTFKTFSCDWEPYDNIDLVIDIGNMKKKDVPFIPDIVWASPDCATYSIAAISHHRDNGAPKSEYAKKCDSVNKHFLNIIKKNASG